MKIETTRFGTVNIDEEKIIEMPMGMLGFPDSKRYFVMKHREGSPFLWFQSIDDPSLAFVITNPVLFSEDYRVDLEGVLEELSWNEDGVDSHLELYVVVNVPRGAPEKMTANLIAPLLINNTKRQAFQIVIHPSPYSHKTPLISH
ncbi:MAG: flagellar assembly protein FliW [Deltaproteobacteria bacterium]|nr:flagellar assembly protein FliW [Deltaproteobacteria bacterium]MBW2138935.1 flagellar assembly protein FliW [Deltaproteobacteria bacterium]